MRSIIISILASAIAFPAGLQGQQILPVSATKCVFGQGVFLVVSTHHSDPYCASFATAPGGGCTQWKLFRNGQLVLSKYTVPAGGGTQVPSNPPLDYYNIGRFLLSQPGQYQVKMSYSRRTCSGWWIFKTCKFDVFVNETPVLTVTANDLNLATWNLCPLGSFDGANCFVMAKPPNGFIWGQGFYVPASNSSKCPAGTFDGANCFLMPKPANGFIWNNGFYVPAGPGGTCSVGTFDSANCFIMKAPWGSTAFEYNGNFYVTPLSVCSQGSFDGANCLLATAPAGTTMFEWGGNFYVTSLHPCR